MIFQPFSDLFRRRRRVHLDYAAGTPIDPSVMRTMQPYFSSVWANPSAVYREGVQAREAVEVARREVADTLKIRSEDVVFTGSGTESNNLAIMGTVEALRRDGRAYRDMEIISTRIEHPSVGGVLDDLARAGVAVRYLPVGDGGRIDMNALSECLSQKTVLVTVAYVNSEIGVIQDIRRITRTVRAWNVSQGATVRVHTDASQAPLWLPCGFDTLGVDLMTLDVGKCYGPKGVGVLAMRHGIALEPQLRGGGQERGLRSSTENVPLIVGCAKALSRAQGNWKERSERITALRDFMFSEIKAQIPEAHVNGDPHDRVANNVNVSIPRIDGEFAVIVLDAHGIAASTRSACGSVGKAGSAVVREITKDETLARSTIRFSFGESSTRGDIIRAVRVLREHVFRTRSFLEKMEKSKGKASI